LVLAFQQFALRHARLDQDLTARTQEDRMRKAVVLGLVCFLGATMFGQSAKLQPLNVKTGLWQVTNTSTMSGAPPITPEMQARLDQMSPDQRARIEAQMKTAFGGAPHTSSYKKCVTAKDLNTDAFGKEDQKCNWTVVNSTASEMEVRAPACMTGEGDMKADIDVKILALDSANVKATSHVVLTGSGHTMTSDGTMTGKWLGSSCPAGTD
jgi:uncharacterized protein DUF3617